MIVQSRKVHLVIVVSLLVGCSAAIAASRGTGQTSAPARTSMDELLAELRALRADLDRAAAASMRGQLLGMRLQLQEQRIAALSRQLSDIQQRLRENTQTRNWIASSLKMFGLEKSQAGQEKAEQMAMVFKPLKDQLANLDKLDAELKAEEAHLSAQLQEEQNRWAAFNGQIEELERAAAGRMR